MTTRRESEAEPKTEHAAPQGPLPSRRYRLTIEGDEALMRQLSAAVELQFRLQLGQFEAVYREIEAGVYERAHETGRRLYIDKDAAATDAERKLAKERFDALMDIRDELNCEWASARRTWAAYFSERPSHMFATGRLAGLSPHVSSRERRAYALWKWLEHCLLHLHMRPENESLMRGTVHYDRPSHVAPDIAARVARIDPEPASAAGKALV